MTFETYLRLYRLILKQLEEEIDLKKLLIFSFAILFLFSCEANKESTNDPTKDTNNSLENAPTEERVSLTQFFLANETTALFSGVGNEYASYSLKTERPYNNYVLTYEDNGGTVVQRIYRISDSKISILAVNGEAYNAKTPSLEQLNAMKEKEIYLSTPLKIGTEFSGWKIISLTSSLKTVVRNFDNVIVVEQKDEQGNTNRKYFAKDFGEIKREYITNENGNEVIISSTITKIM